LVAALAIDATGTLGMAVREISPTRIAAVGLVFAGLVLSRL
jgi:bacterial/archaeal transporter family-2 protein